MKSPSIIGQPIKRLEDERLLTGQALFVDDVHLPTMLHAAFYRCEYAHARVNSLNLARARALPGVIAVYSAEDLGNYWQRAPLLVPPPPIPHAVFHARTHYPLAKDKVCYAGEPLAVIVAESRYLAEDAAQLIEAGLEPLAAAIDLEQALAAQAPRVHEDLESNLAAHIVQQKGNYQTAKRQAEVVIQRRFHYDRGTAAALENRGIVADWNARSQLMTIWDTTQAPIPIRNGLARMLGLAESQVHVIAPFIGGGFGPKIMMFYSEEMIIPWIALQLQRPVKWIEDRQENFFATTQERGQIHDAEMALTRDGKIIGVSDYFLHDNGAYNPYGLTVPINSQCTLLGSYRVPNYYSEFKAVFTNKPIVTPYRGAGRQHGVFVMERLLDIAAKQLGLDRVEIRRKNLLQPEEFPHNHEIIYQDFAPLIYDSGNYAPALARAAEMIGYEKFIQEEQPRLQAEGRHPGIGIVTYIEGTGIGPYEGARVTVESNGKVSLVTGVGTQGQGHYTSFAQIAAEQLGVEATDVRVVTGDTRQFHWGTGTFASRGAVVAGNACYAAARAVREKILKLAGTILQIPQTDLVLAQGKVFAKNDPTKTITLGDLALRANPLRGAVAPGTEPGLEATAYFGPDRGTTASGVHAMKIEVDPETMQIKILDYVVVHDCGKVLNPMILAGQIMGGVAQGIGNAYYEQLFFDDNGQLMNASFMDYLLPQADNVSRMRTEHFETPSPLNPLGVKGAGEAGAIPVGALFAQAIEDAFPQLDLEIREIPLSPNRLFELLQSAKSRIDDNARE